MFNFIGLTRTYVISHRVNYVENKSHCAREMIIATKIISRDGGLFIIATTIGLRALPHVYFLLARA